MDIIKNYPDGSKRLKFEGIEFATNPEGVIMWAEDWTVVDLLMKAGLSTETFYKHLYGHIEHKLK
jgi:hypothetical protein